VFGGGGYYWVFALRPTYMNRELRFCVEWLQHVRTLVLPNIQQYTSLSHILMKLQRIHINVTYKTQNPDKEYVKPSSQTLDGVCCKNHSLQSTLLEFSKHKMVH
jgi:hypothetical protein